MNSVCEKVKKFAKGIGKIDLLKECDDRIFEGTIAIHFPYKIKKFTLHFPSVWLYCVDKDCMAYIHAIFPISAGLLELNEVKKTYEQISPKLQIEIPIVHMHYVSVHHHIQIRGDLDEVLNFVKRLKNNMIESWGEYLKEYDKVWEI